MMHKGKKMMGKKKMDKMGPKPAPTSGTDPHAMQDKYMDKQKQMFMKPKHMMKKEKNMGSNFKGAYGGK